MVKKSICMEKTDEISRNGYNKIESWNEENIKELSSIYYRVLKLIGENPDREGLIKTPERVAKALHFLTMGYSHNPCEIINSAKFKEDYKQMVPYKPVDFWYKSELTQNYEKIRQYQLVFYYDNQWKPEYDQWVNLLAGWTLNKDYKLIAWNAALTYDMIFTQPVVQEFPLIKSPTLLIIGTRDRTALGKALAKPEVQKTMGLYNELGRKTQQKIPGSKLVEIENVGHLPHIEAFDRFIAPLLQFLSE